jgi:alanine racemase
MASTSYIEIDRDALDSNISFLKGLLGNATQISAVLKGNAYGHGLSTILPALEELGIDHFSVYSSAEARQAHEHASPGSIIMVMGYIDPGDLEWIIRHNVEFYISDPDSLEAALVAAQQLGVAAKIHLELETGMYRTGLTLPQLRLAISVLLANTDLLHVRGISSHFAGA